jgi:DNA-binding transcriptional ArsR family regulator
MNDRDLLEVFKALANDRRLKIIKLLMKNPSMTVGSIAARIRLSFKSTSRHLFRLSRAGLLNFQKVGLNIQYSLNKTPTNKRIIDLIQRKV